jgi:hypothetical protein
VSTTDERVTLGVVVERRRVDLPWASDRWTVVELLSGRPAAEPWTVLAEGEGWRRYYAGTVDLELFRGETDNYRDNLASERPAVFVILRPEGDGRVALYGATIDPGEIEAHSDAGDDLVEALPMPPHVLAWMEGFVARHHVERPFYKRQRDRPDPEALALRRRDRGAPARSDGEPEDG